MSLVKKLQLRQGQTVRLINPPRSFEIDAPVRTSGDAVLLFARDSSALRADGKPAIEAAKEDRLAWIAYPKAGKLETDLNRDKLALLVRPMGIGPVRVVSIDDAWSALRFRPRRERP